jgi:DNA/RNA-binding domain of Phe-tRNA-synthetase-like protein
VEPPPFEVRLELVGWELFWARLTLPDEADTAKDEDRSADLAALRVAVTDWARAELKLATLSSHPTLAVLRSLFKTAGCDPTRYRASSESLLRRILKGEDLPAVHPLVDLANCLSATLLVPCSVAVVDTFEPPVVLRAGRDGESYPSFRGPLKLDGKPLLADARGPFDSPITSSRRTGVRPDTRGVWLVAYLPARVVLPDDARRTLRDLVSAAPVATLESPSVARESIPGRQPTTKEEP